jgi:hypothetical protein
MRSAYRLPLFRLFQHGFKRIHIHHSDHLAGVAVEENLETDASR